MMCTLFVLREMRNNLWGGGGPVQTLIHDHCPFVVGNTAILCVCVPILNVTTNISGFLT